MALRLPHHRASTITLVAVALTLLPLGPLTAASASTTGSAQAGELVVLHNELLGTDPPEGATLDTGPARVALTFDLPAQRGFSTVVVTGPDGNQWQAGPPTEEAAMVWAPVRPLGPAGDYTVAWRIISTDGHPTRGTFQFTLTTPGPGTAAAPTSATGNGSAGPGSTGTGSTGTGSTGPGSTGTVLWPWLIGAGVLLVVGLVLALRASRTRG